MERKKIQTTLLILSILFPTLITFCNTYIENVGAQPGVDEFGDATTNLVYGVSYSTVNINSSQWIGAGPFFLYYPVYRSGGTEGNANTFNWDGPYQIAGYEVRVNLQGNNESLDTGGSPITFNRSGIWIFDNDATHAGNDESSYAGYLWVNTSKQYSIEDVPDITFGSSNTMTITVDTGNDSGCMIAIMNPNKQTIYHKWRATGVTEQIEIKGNFTLLGVYKVKAYRDFDAQNSTYYYPDEYYNAGGITENYSKYYGSNYSGHFPTHPSLAPEYYEYTCVGPWDPPEKNAADVTFTVREDQPPDAPLITGPSQGVVNETYTVTLTVSDPDGGTLFCLWNWGDCNESDWLGPFFSGQTINLSHTWARKGIFDISAILKDDCGLYSNWSHHLFTVYTVQDAFIFGKITNLSMQMNFTTFEAVRTRVITWSPFTFTKYVAGEKFIISDDYKGRVLVTPRSVYIIAFCKMIV
jgi:hypothetical protein